jgi:hypothetical protein
MRVLEKNTVVSARNTPRNIVSCGEEVRPCSQSRVNARMDILAVKSPGSSSLAYNFIKTTSYLGVCLWLLFLVLRASMVTARAELSAKVSLYKFAYLLSLAAFASLNDAAGLSGPRQTLDYSRGSARGRSLTSPSVQRRRLPTVAAGLWATAALQQSTTYRLETCGVC